MFQKIIAPVIAAVALAFGSANATILGFDYVGTFSGNDSETAVNDVIAPDMVTLLAKINCDDDACSNLDKESKAISSDFFTITSVLSGGEAKSGTFTFEAGSGFLLKYLVVKAGPNFALYELATAASSGTFDWNTMDLQNKGLSHLSFYGIEGGDPVPVPAAIWLMGAGLAGLGLARRKKVAA